MTYVKNLENRIWNLDFIKFGRTTITNAKKNRMPRDENDNQLK